jgi:hypothetical protein
MTDTICEVFHRRLRGLLAEAPRQCLQVEVVHYHKGQPVDTDTASLDGDSPTLVVNIDHDLVEERSRSSPERAMNKQERTIASMTGEEAKTKLDNHIRELRQAQDDLENRKKSVLSRVHALAEELRLTLNALDGYLVKPGPGGSIQSVNIRTQYPKQTEDAPFRTTQRVAVIAAEGRGFGFYDKDVIKGFTVMLAEGEEARIVADDRADQPLSPGQALAVATDALLAMLVL